MKNDDYWINFWKEHSKNSKNKDSQTQVLRTLNKKPIDKNEWDQILQFVLFYMNIKKHDIVLDLFGGNGLFASEIAKICKRVDVVDISKNY
ncbi:MAG: hypothetical protein U5N56_00885 [Candidatus Marinimicrobia bacterium]|nr:hypothetical protein [Candidatus Neomarinimicrobiota bacterium]